MCELKMNTGNFSLVNPNIASVRRETCLIVAVLKNLSHNRNITVYGDFKTRRKVFFLKRTSQIRRIESCDFDFDFFAIKR